jgi:hypothetical protein
VHRTALRVILLAALASLLAVPVAHGASPNLVISQVYASGGNAGASFANDYVELFNRGTTTVDLSGWTLQYASAASTGWSSTTLAGTIQPGKRYLVQLASSGSVGAALPTPDATGTSNLAATGGKIAVVHGTSDLTCGAAAGSCSAVSAVVDLLGYGSATDFEGAVAPAPGATSALIRAGGGCTDNDANATDFAAGTPAPGSSATAAAPCSGIAVPTADAGVDIQIDPALSIALERPTISFGHAVGGDTPAPVSEHVTVVSNLANGYSLTVHRAAFTPADLPLGIAVGSGSLQPIPIAPALDLLLASSTTRSVAGGDVVATSLGFSSLPSVAPGLYTSTVTFTVVGR